MEDELVFIEKIRAELEDRIELYRNAGCNVEKLVKEFEKLKLHLEVVHEIQKSKGTVSLTEQTKVEEKKVQEQRAETRISELSKPVIEPAREPDLVVQAKEEAKKLQDQRTSDKTTRGGLARTASYTRMKRRRTNKIK